jgi:acyl-CoA hydrolase
VSLAASVNYVGRTSLVVGIRVTAENVETGTVVHTNTSYFTMVAKDAEGKPREVPPLALETREDVRRCIEALRRKEIRLQFQDDFNNEKSRLLAESPAEILKGERVVILEM